MVEIRRMGPQIGVEVTDVDVKALDDARFAPIYQAWLDHNILVVRDQELEIRDFLRYSRRFGPVVPHPSKSTRHPEIPEITLLGINKFDADGRLNDAIYRRGAEGWHTDGAYNQQPFKATQLYALAVPSRGGDTLFASGYAAYAALPERVKRRLDGVTGAFAYSGRRGGSPLLDKEDQDWKAVFHPIIRTHPETGRKSLYFDPGKIVDIVGADRSESDALIAELKGYMIQPDAEYRHKWRKGDIVIWTTAARTTRQPATTRLRKTASIGGSRSTIMASKPKRPRNSIDDHRGIAVRGRASAPTSAGSVSAGRSPRSSVTVFDPASRRLMHWTQLKGTRPVAAL